jgi:hypothetical protein
MEIASKTFFERIKEIFLKEAKPFTKKREIHWLKVKITIASILVIVLVSVLFWPATRPQEISFHEKTNLGNVVSSPSENDPTQDTLGQLQASRVNTASVHSSLDYLYKENSSVNGGGNFARSGSSDRNGTMILSRGGNDSRTQLSSGTRFLVVLPEKTIVANQAMPIIGIVIKDVMQENDIAIPQGAKLIGDISFDDSNERAQINWRSIIMPDGRERPFSGIGVGRDGQVGVEGNVKSEALKNTMGQTLTRFIGAYAEGSMSQGQLGANEGGHQNGMKKAVAATAKDRASAWAEDMNKEKKWIELQMGAEFYTVLNQPFLFRDPGATHGR